MPRQGFADARVSLSVQHLERLCVVNGDAGKARRVVVVFQHLRAWSRPAMCSTVSTESNA